MNIAFITGVSTGIGKDALHYFVSQGYKVIGTVRKDTDKQSIVNTYGDKVEILTFDVRDTDGMNRNMDSVRNLLNEHGLKVLINNAGMAVPGPLQYIPEDDFEAQLDVNIKSVRRITNVLLPYLGVDKKYRPGIIINISSVSGLFSSPFNAAYSISKYGLEAMSDGYRRELAPMGIKVAIIEPGPIKTEIWGKQLGSLDKYISTEYGEILSKADKIIANAEKSALPVSAVTNTIDKIMTSSSPKTRYLVHPKPLIFKLFTQWFTDKMQDKMVQKTFARKDKHRPF
jgi:NAD(P)-dependent dehydrogenase (short-subunit alcohol dehydrogenase family)